MIEWINSFGWPGYLLFTLGGLAYLGLAVLGCLGLPRIVLYRNPRLGWWVGVVTYTVAMLALFAACALILIASIIGYLGDDISATRMKPALNSGIFVLIAPVIWFAMMRAEIRTKSRTTRVSNRAAGS